MSTYQYIFTLKELTKVFSNGKKCFENITLSFLPGVKIGLVGVNGAGKSTLLKIMAGDEKDFLGEAYPAKGIKVGYLPQEPKLDTSKNVRGMRTEQLFEMIASCMHEIYEGEKVHSVKDYSTEDLHKFLENCNGDVFKKINEFFETMPMLKHELELENPKTKVKNKIVLKGAQDFFALPSLTTA